MREYKNRYKNKVSKNHLVINYLNLNKW